MGAAFQLENFVFHLISIEIFQINFSTKSLGSSVYSSIYSISSTSEKRAGWLDKLSLYNCFQNYLDGPCTLPLKARDGEGVGNI